MSEIPAALTDLDAEKQCLGAPLLDSSAVEEMRDLLEGPADFYDPKHELIWRAMIRLVEADQPVQVQSVNAALDRAGELGRVGGPMYAFDLMSGCTTPKTAGFYARKVAERAKARRCWQMALQAAAHFAEGGDPSVIADALSTRILDAVAGSGVDSSRTIGDLHAEFSETLFQPPADEDSGVMCRWPYRDGAPVLADLRAGNLVIVAGRPGLGKSTVALDLARSVALKQGGTALVFSLEMSHQEWWERFIAATAGVSYQRIAEKKCTDADLIKIERHREEIDAAPLVIDHHSGATIAHIRQSARKLQRKQGLSVVVIDYLQLMLTATKADSREREVSELSRSLKLLAQSLGVPVVVLSQLNRGPEQRADHKPQMSDLRESGSQEQDADQVVLVFREDAYELESPRAGEVDLIVAKNRRGPQGTVTLAAQLHMARFVDMAGDDIAWGRAS